MPQDSIRLTNNMHWPINYWAFLVPSFAVLVSIASFYVSYKTSRGTEERHKSDRKKSIYDDHWYQKVIHPECYEKTKEYFDNCVAQIDIVQKETLTPDEKLNTFGMYLREQQSALRTRLKMIEVLPEAQTLTHKLNTILINYEDAIMFYALESFSCKQLPEGDIESVDYFTRKLSEFNVMPIKDLTSAFFKFHLSLSS